MKDKILFFLEFLSVLLRKKEVREPPEDNYYQVTTSLRLKSLSSRILDKLREYQKYFPGAKI